MIEILLLISISAQLLVGACLVVHRIRIKCISGFWGWLQVISGIVFFLFMIQHLFSLGMTRLYFELDTNFYWPSSVMSGPWFIYYFAPYYTFGVFALFAHIGAGIRFAMIDRGNPFLGQRVGVSLLVAGAIMSLIIPLILAGIFFPIDLPDEWIDYLRFYAPNFES